LAFIGDFHPFGALDGAQFAVPLQGFRG
jgi:hypothetical protein